MKVAEQDDCICKEEAQIADVIPKLEYKIMNHRIVGTAGVVSTAVEVEWDSPLRETKQS